MAKRSTTELAFSAIRIEGGLLAADFLGRVARFEATGQTEADYDIPKGLKLRDEIGRYWKIALNLWQDFQAGRQRTDHDAHSFTSKDFLEPFCRHVLGFTDIQAIGQVVLDERIFPIGYQAVAGQVPLVFAAHSLGLEQSDARFGDGHRRRSPFLLAQEYLNAEDKCLWAIVSNGLKLRILRDNPSLTRPAYIEVDLEAIFNEERYPDFTAFWLLAHATRFGRTNPSPLTGEGVNPADCHLERWRNTSQESGIRARERLRDGVGEALRALGTGFVSHSKNTALREQLDSGALSAQAYYEQLLRLIYRFIFLATLEDRQDEQSSTPLGHAAYTRGIQIIHPRRSKKAIFSGVTGRWFGEKNREHAEFIAYDWRNNRIAKISTDPNATANYFNAEGNSLPFELSPSFFKPEVLSKYKANREKYTVGERDVSCRATWHLEGIDVNEAGQVHAYICDLRHLPYAEQLHWLSFNEAPKASISKRAVINDFKGEFVTFVEPLQRVLAILRHWQDTKVAWWTLRDERLLAHVNTPLTENRDEWAEAFMDLTKLVVEGFEIKFIRAGLDAAHIPYEENEKDKTIALLEKLLGKVGTSGETGQLDGLRTAQRIRSKVKGHTAGSDANQIAQNALMEHGTFTDHFRHICMQVADELDVVERILS